MRIQGLQRLEPILDVDLCAERHVFEIAAKETGFCFICACGGGGEEKVRFGLEDGGWRVEDGRRMVGDKERTEACLSSVGRGPVRDRRPTIRAEQVFHYLACKDTNTHTRKVSLWLIGWSGGWFGRVIDVPMFPLSALLE